MYSNAPIIWKSDDQRPRWTELSQIWNWHAEARVRYIAEFTKRRTTFGFTVFWANAAETIKHHDSVLKKEKGGNVKESKELSHPPPERRMKRKVSGNGLVHHSPPSYPCACQTAAWLSWPCLSTIHKFLYHSWSSVLWSINILGFTMLDLVLPWTRTLNSGKPREWGVRSECRRLFPFFFMVPHSHTPALTSLERSQQGRNTSGRLPWMMLCTNARNPRLCKLWKT